MGSLSVSLGSAVAQEKCPVRLNDTKLDRRK